MWKRQCGAFTDFDQSYINCPDLWHKIIFINLDHLDILQHNTLVHYITNTVLIGAGEQKVANIMDDLVRHMWPKG